MKLSVDTVRPCAAVQCGRSVGASAGWNGSGYFKPR